MDERALFPGWAKDLIDSRSVNEACYTGLLTSQRPGTPIVYGGSTGAVQIRKHIPKQTIPTCHPPPSTHYNSHKGCILNGWIQPNGIKKHAYDQKKFKALDFKNKT